MTQLTRPPSRRIQRRRTAGWRMPAGAVYVGRPTRYGNPYQPDTPTAADRATAIDRYRQWLILRLDLITAARRDLTGRDLACWCPLDQPCHADVLLSIINQPTPPPADTPPAVVDLGTALHYGDRLHDAAHGNDCDCRPQVRRQFIGYAELLIGWMTEDGLLATDAAGAA
ncbi:DUF4326 domain-containing protein [Micromonospora sp. SCSIO 07396]